MPVYRSYNVRALSFYRPDTGEVAQFDLIVGTTFEVVSTPVKQLIQGGKRVPVMDRVTLKVTLIDNGLREQLLSWARNHVGVRAVAAGTPNLQWYETGYLRITQENKREDGLWAFTVELEADQVFGQKTIHMNANLLAYLGWQDSNANNAADNYTFTGLGPTAFSSLIQSLGSVGNYSSMSTGILANAGNAVVFPISGIRIDASIDVTTLHTVLNYHFQTFRARSFANAELNSVVLSSPSIGVKVVQQTTPNSTYYLVYEFAQGNGVATTGGMGVRCPAMTTDRSLTPGTSFMSW
jgi:hypothetical protein